MRLADKKQIQLSVAVERQAEIEQGVLLAKKIDALRQAKLNEEASLNKFRDQSTKNIQKDIDSLLVKKDSVIAEIKAETEYLALLRKPLDWEQVRLRKIELDSQKELLAKRELLIIQQELQITQRLEDIEENESRIQEKKRQVAERLQIAEDLRIQTEQDSVRKSQEYKKFKQQTKEIENNLFDRQANIAVAERELKLRQDSIFLKERDIITRTALIVDREQTLEREINRQTHG